MANTFKAKTILATSGLFSQLVSAPNLVYNTGDQTISGTKNFPTRPQYNTSGLALLSEVNAVSGSLTGLLNTTGLALWNRDISLSGNFDTSGANLWGRDVSLSGSLNATGLNLSNKIDLLSGYTTGTFATNSGLNATGLALWNRDILLSGSLNATGLLLDTYCDSLSGNLIATGLALWNRDAALSGNLIASGFLLDSYCDALSGNLIATGITLWNRDISLSGSLIATGFKLDAYCDTISGNLNSSGINLWNRDVALSGSLNETGQFLNLLISALSGSAGDTANLVHTTGGQVVSGLKNFITRPQYNGGDLALLSEISISGTTVIYDKVTGLAYTANAMDYVLITTNNAADATITLPTAVGIAGKMYIIKSYSTKATRIIAIGGQIIDGSSTLNLGARYNHVQIMSDGANWITVG